MDQSVDDVSNLEGAKVAAGIGSGGCLKATVLSKVAEDFDGKNRLSLAKPEKVIQIVDSVIVWEDVGNGSEVAI